VTERSEVVRARSEQDLY